MEFELSVEGLQDRLRTLRADLAEAEQAARAASERAREAMIRGDEGAELAVQERAEAHARVETLREAVRDLEELIEAGVNAKIRTRAKERMLAIKRAHASLLTQGEGDAARVAEAAAALAEAVDRLNRRYRDLLTLHAEALVLAERFDLSLPDLPRPTPPSAVAQAASALKEVRALTLAKPDHPPRSLSDQSYRSALPWNVVRTLERVAGTPTADLLERAGMGILADPEAWDRRLRERGQAKREEEERQRVAEMERYDAWLREQLAEGPVLISEIRRRAEDAGLAFRMGEGPIPWASVTEASQRIGVFAVVSEDDPRGPRLWTLKAAEGYVVPPDVVAAGWR
jgi:hypothetical protein